MNQRQFWFPEITKGFFKYQRRFYSTIPMIAALGHAVDWHQNPPVPVKTERGHYCGKISKERIKIIDPYTIQVQNKPLYFWDGPRDPDLYNENYGYSKNIEGPDGGTEFDADSTVSSSGEIVANNPWPRYIPPHLLDAPVCEEDYGFWPESEAHVSGEPAYCHGIDIYINKVLVSNEIIETYDFWNGLIVFKHPINPEDVIEVTYLYEQVKAVIPDVNLNPIYPELPSNEETEFIECIKV